MGGRKSDGPLPGLDGACCLFIARIGKLVISVRNQDQFFLTVSVQVFLGIAQEIIAVDQFADALLNICPFRSVVLPGRFRSLHCKDPGQ